MDVRNKMADKEIQDNPGFLPECDYSHGEMQSKPDGDSHKDGSQPDQPTHYDTPGDVYHRFAENTSIHGLKHASNVNYRPVRR